jgi:transcriptional regulator with XRE-family HTH domain
MSRTVKPTGSRLPDFRSLEERLWYSRERAGLTQQELADQLGISKRSVQNYEAGVGHPRENRLVLWANATDFDYAWLAGDFYDNHPDERSVGTPVTPIDQAGVTGRSLSSHRYQFSRNVIVDRASVARAA